MTIRTLIVAVRGWTNTGDFLLFGRPGGQFPPDTLKVAAGLPNAEIWAPELDLTMFNMDDAEELSKRLFNQIDAKLSSMPAIDSIVLLRYSAGSLLVRRVFCMAHGADPDGVVREEKAVPWASSIHRIVILADHARLGVLHRLARSSAVSLAGSVWPR